MTRQDGRAIIWNAILAEFGRIVIKKFTLGRAGGVAVALVWTRVDYTVSPDLSLARLLFKNRTRS